MDAELGAEVGAEEYAQALDELVRRGLVLDLGGRYALSPRVRGVSGLPDGGGIARAGLMVIF